MNRNFKLVFLICFWGLLLIGLLAFQVDLVFLQRQRSEKPAFKPGDLVPDFTLPSLEGKTYQLSEAVKDGNVLLIFFSPANGPSRIEVMEFNDYVSKDQPAGYQVLLISDESRDDLEQFNNELTVKFPILHATSLKVFKDYKIGMVPANFLIDQNRKLIYAQVGAEGFNVYKVQALVKYRSGGFRLEERPEKGHRREGEEKPRP